MDLKTKETLLALADDAEKFYAAARDNGSRLDRADYLVGYWIAVSACYSQEDNMNLEIALFTAKMSGGISRFGLDNSGHGSDSSHDIPTYDGSLAALRANVEEEKRLAA